MSGKNKKRSLTLWGIGSAGEGFISIISSTYLSYFLTDVAKLSLGTSSAVLLVTSISAFLLATFMGAVVAAVKPMKWGRLRSWLLVGPPVAAVFFVIHFTYIEGNEFLSALIISVGYIVAIAAYNFTFTSALSLTNVLCRSQEDRNKINSQRMMGSNIGRLMGNYLTPVIVGILAVNVTDRFSYPILVAIAGVFFIVTEFVQFKLSEGAEDEYHEALGREDHEISLKDMFDVLKTNHQLLVTILIDLSSNMAALALPSLSVYYYKYVTETPGMVSTHMLCIGLAGFAGSALVRIFGKKVKSYRGYLLSVYLVISVLLFATKLVQGNAVAFLCINIFVHLLTGTTQPFEINLYQDNVIYSEWKTGVNSNSLIMGLGELPVRIASILKSVLLTFALASAGYVAGADPTPTLKNALSNSYAFIPACIPLIGFILLLFAYRLRPEKVAEMKKEITERYNKQA